MILEVEVINIPSVAKLVIIKKPSARPIRSTNLAVGSLIAPPITEDKMEVVPVRGSNMKEEVT